MSSSTSTSTSITNSTTPIAPNINITPSAAIYHDLWSYNFTAENFIQHRIRLVKVNGESYIAFSKFFLNPITLLYQPSKKHYFIPQRRWAQLQAGLFELNNFLNAVNNGAAAAAGTAARTELGGLHTATSTAGPTGTRAPPTRTIDLSIPNSTIPTTNPLNGTNYSYSSSGIPQHITLQAFAHPPFDATKRGRGRPPKDSSYSKRSKPTLREGCTEWLSKQSTSCSAPTSAAAASAAEILEQEEERIDAAVASAAAEPNPT